MHHSHCRKIFILDESKENLFELFFVMQILKEKLVHLDFSI
jgi:hypothetical protein